MSDATEIRLPLEIEDIKRILPHRYPFLHVDRIVELEPDRRVVGIKNVSILIKPENRSRLIYFMGIDRVRYRRPVRAGDAVYLEGTVVRLRGKMGTLRGVARVDGRIVCEGQMNFALAERP
jgi:3-hydroxyacyl-[acyl-carrier-protein] dehydratase